MSMEFHIFFDHDEGWEPVEELRVYGPYKEHRLVAEPVEHPDDETNGWPGFWLYVDHTGTSCEIYEPDIDAYVGTCGMEEEIEYTDSSQWPTPPFDLPVRYGVYTSPSTPDGPGETEVWLETVENPIVK